MVDKQDELFDRLAIVGKAFANAKRLALLDVLTRGERTVETLARETELGLSTASAHLQVLKLASVVSTRKEGARVYYALAGDDVASLYAVLRTVALRHSADVERALNAYLGVGGEGHVDEVSRDELVERLRDGDVLLLDVRPSDEFAVGHIPGARSVPFEDVEEAIAALDTDAEIIAYCRGAYCLLAHDAVRLLHAAGRPARRLEDGMLEWRLAGLPVEESA